MHERSTADRFTFAMAALVYAALLFEVYQDTVMGLISKDPAGWVQAVGAIGAIIVTGWSIRWQVGEQGRQQRDLLIKQQDEQRRQGAEDEIRRLRIVASEFFHCRTMLETMVHRLRRGLSFDAEFEQLAHRVERIYAIPAMEVPDARAAYAISSARSAVETLRRELLRIEGTGARAADQREQRLNVALTYLESHEETVADCLSQRGSTPLHLTYTLDDRSEDELLRLHSHGHPALLGFQEADFGLAH